MLGKVQGVSLSFGNLKVDSDYPTRYALNGLVDNNKEVSAKLKDAIESMDKSSGDTRITLYGLAMPRKDTANYNLIVRSHYMRNIPVVKIPSGATAEEKCQKIELLAADIEKRFSAVNKDLNKTLFDKRS